MDKSNNYPARQTRGKDYAYHDTINEIGILAVTQQHFPQPTGDASHIAAHFTTQPS
jgi:hypothetical protein